MDVLAYVQSNPLFLQLTAFPCMWALSSCKQQGDHDLVALPNAIGEDCGVDSFPIDIAEDVAEQLTMLVQYFLLDSREPSHQIAQAFADRAAIDLDGFLVVRKLLEVGIREDYLYAASDHRVCLLTIGRERLSNSIR